MTLLEDPEGPIPIFFSLINSVFAKPLDLGIVIALVVMAILLILSALISGSEVAFFSISPSEKEEIGKSDSGKQQTILELLERPKRLLATILISNNFVNVAIIILSTYIVDGIFEFAGHPTLKFLIQVVAITFILLLLGEVIPKIYAAKKAPKLAGIMSFPLFYLSKTFYPLSTLLIKSTSLIDKRIKRKGHNISKDELSHALELTTDISTGEEQKILKGIVKFGDTTVKQIMRSRVDVVAFDQNMNFDEVVEIILEAGFSRIPVFKENFDNITGVLYIKDLIPHLSQKSGFQWGKLIRDPFFVPENKKLDDLLREFQHKKIHLAIVVDEYGGTSGIITLEDVLEEIVGEISDEFDDEDLVYSKLDDKNFVFEGKTPLNDMYRVLEVEDEEAFEQAKGDSDTLAGFIIEFAGKIPLKNEKIKFENFLFVVEAADKRRVKRIKVTILDENEIEENERK